MLWGTFSCHGLVSLDFLTDHLQAIIKHSWWAWSLPEWSVVYSIHRVQELTECFNEYENNVNHSVCYGLYMMPQYLIKDTICCYFH